MNDLYKELEKLLPTIDSRSKLYLLIRDEMKKRGNWKAKPRGKAFSKGEDKRRFTIEHNNTQS